MLVSNCQKNTAIRHFSIGLAASILVTTAMTISAQAQIGPVQPPPKPTMENHVTKALSTWLKGTKKADNPNAKTSRPAPRLTPDDNLINGGVQQGGTASAYPEKPKAPKPDPNAKLTPAISHPPLLVQPPLSSAKIDKAQIDPENPPVLTHPKLADPNNPLGFADAENKLRRLISLVSEKRFTEAKPGLMQLRQSLVDLTEAHIGLYKTLNQVPSARGQAELEKELALEFAQLRDRTMLETAKVYISERDYSKAVKELADVVKSQPRSKLGIRSYEMLQEIGFTEKLQLTQ